MRAAIGSPFTGAGLGSFPAPVTLGSAVPGPDGPRHYQRRIYARPRFAGTFPTPRCGPLRTKPITQRRGGRRRNAGRRCSCRRTCPSGPGCVENGSANCGCVHHPAPSLEPGFLFDALGLFAATADVGDEAELLQGAPHLVNVVPLVQAHPLGILWTGLWSGYRKAVHRGSHQLHVMTVGSVHCQSHWNRGLSQQAALDAPLASVGGVGAGFSPRPGAIWSWRRPYSPNSSPDPSVRHCVPVPLATTPGTPQRQPIPESAGERWSRNRCRWHPGLFTGSRCAARRRCHWRRCGREPGDGRRRTDGCSHTQGATAPTLPTTHRRSGKHRCWDLSWWLGQHA